MRVDKDGIPIKGEAIIELLKKVDELSLDISKCQDIDSLDKVDMVSTLGDITYTLSNILGSTYEI